MTTSSKICFAEPPKKALYLFLSFILIAMTQTVFAQSKACQEEKSKVIAMKKKCSEINKSKKPEEFNKCSENLKVQTAKTDKVCENVSEQKPVTAKDEQKPVTAKDEQKLVTAKDEKKKENDLSSDTEEDSLQFRWGIRVNFSIPRLYPNTLKTNEQNISLKGGIGYGLGVFAFVSFSYFDFVPEISIQHREVVKTNNLNITETAMEIPFMFRFLYSKGNLIYFGVGPFMGAVLNVIETPTVEDDRKGMKDFRTEDYGAVLEIGLRISDNLSADIRGIASLNPFGIGKYLNANNAPSLMQAQIGISYLF